MAVVLMCVGLISVVERRASVSKAVSLSASAHGTMARKTLNQPSIRTRYSVAVS